MEKRYSGKIIFALLCLSCLFVVWTGGLLAQISEETEVLISVEDRPADEPPEMAPEYYPEPEPTESSPLLTPRETPTEPSSATGAEIEFLIEEKDVVANEIIDVEKKAISLDLRGIEISEFFKVLSKKLDKNIIPSKKVKGRINLFLNNVAYSDVLDIIILSQELAYEKKDEDVIFVMTAAEYEALYGEKFNEKRKIKTLKLKHAPPEHIRKVLDVLKSKVGKFIIDSVTGTVILIDIPERLEVMQKAFMNVDKPSITEVFELQYAKASDIKDNISSIVTPDSSSVLIDERTNTLIVTDLTGNMNKIKQTVKMLDLETRQVFIEAEILQITLRDRFQFGIDWEKLMMDPTYRSLTYKGSFPAASLSDYQQISAGVLAEDKFNVVIQFLNTLGDTKILSRPKIAVINNEEATIMVGERQAYVTGSTSQSGESTITSDSIEFVDVGVKLKVVPIINRDGFITMKIKPEISYVTDTLKTGSEDEPRSIVPIVATSEAETTVKVKDGSTIMIAGLRKNERRKNLSGIPYLSKIPIFGIFFGSRDSDQYQTEIIVFLTPHIIKGENMMSWDREQIKKYPKHLWPESREYIEPKFKKSGLKKPQLFKEEGF